MILWLDKTQRFLQALHHIVNDWTGFGIVDDLPEAGAQVPMPMGIISADGWPYLVDRAEITVEKRTGEGLRDVFASLGIGREIAGAQFLQTDAQVGCNALGFRTARSEEHTSEL